MVVFHEVGTALPEPGVCNDHSHASNWTINEETLDDVASFVDRITGVPVVNPQNVFGSVSNTGLIPYGSELHSDSQFSESGADLAEYYSNTPELVQLDLDGHGVAPSPLDSIRIQGRGKNESTYFFHFLPNQVSSDMFYIAEVTVNLASLKEGLLGFYIDEYNEKVEWISGQHVGGIKHDGPSRRMVRTIVDVYQPSSVEVQNVRLQVYLDAAEGSVTIDNLSFRKL